MEQPSYGKPQAARRDEAGNRFWSRLNLLWTAIFYINLVLALADAFSSRPQLWRSWEGLAIAALVGVSIALFQLIYQRFFSFINSRWPMDPLSAWIYFAGQAVVLGLLLLLDPNFIGQGFVLMGQTLGVLRPRHWPLPLATFFGLSSWRLGLLADVFAGNWLALLDTVFLVGIYVVIALLISQLFNQRFQLLRLVNDLRQAKAELEASASQQEELAVLRERTRLAREMHDSIGHALVLVNVKLEAAQRLYGLSPDRGDAELEATRALVRETMAGLRRSLGDLRAPLPDHHDLPAALRRLAADASARGPLTVNAVDENGLSAPEPAVAEALWQIAREALRNIERHAAAASASLYLGRDGNCWLLTVSDDGTGIEPADLNRPGHFGLVGMRERAEALGGSLRVARRPQGGTSVEARIPSA